MDDRIEHTKHDTKKCSPKDIASKMSPHIMASLMEENTWLQFSTEKVVLEFIFLTNKYQIIGNRMVTMISFYIFNLFHYNNILLKLRRSLSCNFPIYTHYC